jgi:Undecaprenyl-phosphate galactose phosphotransferase WbaP
MTYADFEARYLREGAGRGRWLPALVFILADLTGILVSFGGGFFLVNLYNIDIVDFKSFVTYWPYLPAFLVVFYVAHLYPGINLAPAEELRRFALTSLLGHAGIILSRLIGSRDLDAYSAAFALSWIVSVPAFALMRALVRSACKKASWWGLHVVIFGGKKTGRLIVDRLLDKPWIGYKPVAMLDDDPALEGSEYRGVPIFKGTDLGPRLSASCGISTAIVAMPGISRDRLSDIIGESVRAFPNYVLIPDFMGMTSIWMSVSDFDGILGLLTLQRLVRLSNRASKRFFDISICIFGGLIVLPFLLVIALLIKIDSRGPVLFGHTRLGKGGKPFTAWKFRSMVANSQEVLDELLARDPEARAEWEATHKLKSDPRITRMGRFLRKHSIDEIPQLLNVLRGEMSLIGPRPIVEDEIAMYGHFYKLLSSVKPGMSGLWQVSGRSDTDYSERVALDVYYIQSWSIWLDLHILFRTAGVALGGNGAY